MEIIRDLLAQEAKLSLKEIASWFTDRYGVEYDQRITPKWIGRLLRQQLHLRPQKSHGIFVVPVSQYPKLKRLFERYGVGESAEPAISPNVGGAPG